MARPSKARDDRAVGGRVMGEQGSLVTGATLLFRNADSTIVVAGTENGPKTPGGTRVHTETDLKQRP